MGFVCVQPVAVGSALFWVICSYCMYVSFVSGCHTGCRTTWAMILPGPGMAKIAGAGE